MFFSISRISFSFASISKSLSRRFLGNSYATLDITLTGFFTELGLHAINSGTVESGCICPKYFTDSGVTVIDTVSQKKVKVHVCVTECECGCCGKYENGTVPLEDVNLKLYDKNCKLINTVVFDGCTTLSLDQGSYVAEISKEGYYKKYLVLLIGSESELYADTCLIKKLCKPSYCKPNKQVDIFEGMILDKFDIDIVFSKVLCIPSRAYIECVNDLIDAFKHFITCTKKLGIQLDIEKNIVYKMDNVKQLKYQVYQERFCLPLARYCDRAEVEHKVNVEKVCFYKERSRLYNIAYIKLYVYVVDHTDIYVNTDYIPSCE